MNPQNNDEPQAPKIKMTIAALVAKYHSFELKFGGVIVRAHTDIYNAIKDYEVEVNLE